MIRKHLDIAENTYALHGIISPPHPSHLLLTRRVERPVRLAAGLGRGTASTTAGAATPSRPSCSSILGRGESVCVGIGRKREQRKGEPAIE